MRRRQIVRAPQTREDKSVRYMGRPGKLLYSPVKLVKVTKWTLPERNDPCFCGSGKKFKKCHGRNN